MENQDIAVSVIVPVYNGAQYIEKCCEQLNRQTIENIEIILVNDGSTDETETVCRRMSEQYSKCRVFSQEKAGVAAARNLGIKNAIGEYLGFVDVDDEYDADMYETLYDIAKENDLDVAGMDNIGNANSLNIYTNQEEILRLFLGGKIRISACYKIYRKSLYPQFSFPEGIQIHEDCMAVYRALSVAKKIGCINVCKYHYIHREGSNSRATEFAEKYLDAVHVDNIIAGEIEKKYPSLHEVCIKKKATTYLRITKIYYLRGAPEKFLPEINSLKDWLATIPNHKLGNYFNLFNCIRYLCYFYCKPLFLLLLKSIDKE